MFSSKELLRIFGFDPSTEQHTHETFLKAIHHEDQERVRLAFDEATTSRTDYQAEYRIVLNDGSIRYVQNIGHPVLSDSDELIEYVGTVMDITARKQSEEAVRAAHERVDLILGSISDQFFGLSKDWRFTYFNRHSAEQMRRLGKDPELMIGKVLWDEFSEVPNEASLRRVMSERVAVTDELYYPPLNEWVENHMYPSQDGGLVTFQRYVTDRKRTEDELYRTRLELNHAARLTTLGEFAA
jgi:PAS domain S-box-containing protein